MKSTGIVRRIDDIGRIVIPKEIRRTMKVREGDPLELFVEGSKLIAMKYDQCEPLKVQLEKLIDDTYESAEWDGKTDFLNDLRSAFNLVKDRKE